MSPLQRPNEKTCTYGTATRRQLIYSYIILTKSAEPGNGRIGKQTAAKFLIFSKFDAKGIPSSVVQ